jgi:DNA-binding NarL/FixJ family response regulator
MTDMEAEFLSTAMNAHPPISTLDNSPANVRVWVVDDSAQIRELVAEALSLHEGIKCERLFASPDALLSELASKPGPDVILLDVQMGDRNGLDAVRPIKSLTRTTHVLMFTTGNNPAWRERALQDGASDYLLKSDSLDNVANRIRCTAQGAPRLYRRRRAARFEAKDISKQPSIVHAEHSPHLLNRTLKFLRFFSN